MFTRFTLEPSEAVVIPLTLPNNNTLLYFCAVDQTVIPRPRKLACPELVTYRTNEQNASLGIGKWVAGGGMKISTSFLFVWFCSEWKGWHLLSPDGARATAINHRSAATTTTIVPIISDS